MSVDLSVLPFEMFHVCIECWMNHADKSVSVQSQLALENVWSFLVALHAMGTHKSNGQHFENGLSLHRQTCKCNRIPQSTQTSWSSTGIHWDSRKHWRPFEEDEREKLEIFWRHYCIARTYRLNAQTENAKIRCRYGEKHGHKWFVEPREWWDDSIKKKEEE